LKYGHKQTLNSSVHIPNKRYV